MFFSILVFIYFVHTQRQFYEKQLKENLLNKAELINDNSATDFNTNTSEKIDEWSKKYGEIMEARITIIRANGEVIADSHDNPLTMDNHAHRPEVKEITGINDTGFYIRYSDTVNREMFYLTLPRVEENKIIGYIRIAKSIEDIQNELRNHFRNYLFFILILFIITFILVIKFSSNIVDPISKITDMPVKFLREIMIIGLN